MNLNRYKSILENINRVALTTHENPDGDGLGCAAAMYHFYKDKNKDCKIILPTSLPNEYEFLEKGSMFQLYSSETTDTWLKDVDLIIIFDVGDSRRLKDIRKAIQINNLSSLLVFSFSNRVGLGYIKFTIFSFSMFLCFQNLLSSRLCNTIYNSS